MPYKAWNKLLKTWFDKFSSFLITYDFMCNTTNPSLFISHSSRGPLNLLLYVDDILLISLTTSYFNEFISILSQQYSMKDLDPLHYFLGI